MRLCRLTCNETIKKINIYYFINFAKSNFLINSLIIFIQIICQKLNMIKFMRTLSQFQNTEKDFRLPPQHSNIENVLIYDLFSIRFNVDLNSQMPNKTNKLRWIRPPIVTNNKKVKSQYFDVRFKKPRVVADR